MDSFITDNAALLQAVGFTETNGNGFDTNENIKNNPQSLLRLLVKHGEYMYARFNDIVMIETCDHFVKVYVASAEKIRIALRHSTLNDFLSLLPHNQFLRLSRFTAVNISRLSAANCNEQFFEFDFRLIIKPKHPITQTILSKIGQ